MSDDLAHYGVKGMKWGVRRSQAALDRAAGRVRSRTKSGKRSTARSSARSMSNEDLQANIQRMELENRYVDLSTNSSSARRGSGFAQQALRSVGNQAVSMIASRAINAAIGSAITQVGRIRN